MKFDYLVPEAITALDAADALAHKRSEFLLPKDQVYLDGNSLGPNSRAANDAVQNALKEQWQQDLIKSWNSHSWIDLPKTVGDKIAAIVGAKAGQVICCDSISVNLFKLLSAALALNPKRSVIVSEEKNFPTDLYIAQGVAKQLGEQRCQLKTVSKDDIETSLNESVAVLMLTHVDFRSGEMLDMQRITQLAHDKGILVLWDLAHSAGALPLDLDNCKADFAVGCGYKYLNGGPGSPAFVYVAERHIATLEQPLSGWMGHIAPFEFNADYKAADSIERMLCGTPPILSLAALDGALDVFADLDMQSIRDKSNDLKKLFIDTVNQSQAAKQSLTLITPTSQRQQGSQLSFTHPNAYPLSQALIDAGVIVDFRAPNIVRFGFTPLYLSFADIYRAAQALCEIIEQQHYLVPKFNLRSKVT